MTLRPKHVRRTWLALALVSSFALTSCEGSGSSRPAASPSITLGPTASASPSTSPVPYDADTAPAVFRSRALLPSCGSFLLRQGDRTPPRDALACFSAALGTSAGAELVVSRPTVEGDPVVAYYRALPGRTSVQVFHDSTRDRYGARRWSVSTCSSFDEDLGQPVGCNEPKPLS